MNERNFFAELRRRNVYKVAVACAIGAILAAAAACADEITVVSNLLGPEGPLFVDGNLYYVGLISNTLSKWDGKKATVLNNTPGCGHNGLALTKHKKFLLACTNDPGAILELDMTGKQLRRWDADSNGKKFEGGINDIVVTANDGAYATVFGPYADPPIPTGVIGRILYFAPDSEKWVEVADDLNYANGIGVSPDQKTLYVSQIDSKGNIYVAQWFGGKILKLSPEGKLLHVFEISAGDGTTDVAFGESEKELYVTVVKDPKNPQANGR